MRILFVAPVVAGALSLGTGDELARIAGGNSLEVCDGAVDRGKLDAFLERQFDVIHFAQHGSRAGLELSDGVLEVADLTSMLERQQGLRLLFVNACNSVATGISLHNAFHVPVVAHDAPIDDRAAVAFAETLYRALRSSDALIHTAFERAVRTLQVRFPSDARTPQLINGDMADKHCMQLLRTEMDDAFRHVNSRLDGIEMKMDKLRNERDRRTQMMIVLLLAVLVAAQLLTPVLNSLLIHMGP